MTHRPIATAEFPIAGDPQLTPDPPAKSSPTRNGLFFGHEGLRAGWGISIFVLLFGLGMGLQVFLLKRLGALPPAGPHGITPRMTLLNDALPALIILFLTALLAKIERRPFSTYGLGGRRRLPQLAAGLAWGVASLSLLVLLLAATGLLHFDGRLLATPAALAYGLAWAGCFFLVGLFEETFMRGYLQITLARGLSAIYGAVSETRHRDTLGFWTAALLLSLLFGAGHHGNAGESPLGLVSAALAGLVFCLSLWRTGSLWWAIGFHAAWDWAQSFLYGVADSGSISQGRLFATHPVGRPILSGGLTGPEGSVFVLLVLALVSAVILLTLPRAPRPASVSTQETAAALN